MYLVGPRSIPSECWMHQHVSDDGSSMRMQSEIQSRRLVELMQFYSSATDRLYHCARVLKKQFGTASPGQTVLFHKRIQLHCIIIILPWGRFRFGTGDGWRQLLLHYKAAQ